MIPALGIAVSGLMDATNRANTAASNIVRNSTTSSLFRLDSQEAAASYARAAGQPETEAGAGTGTGTGSTANLGGQAQPMPRYVPSMAEDMVMMREAVHAYKANAKVIRQLDQVTSELIDVLKTDKRG